MEIIINGKQAYLKKKLRLTLSSRTVCLRVATATP